MYLQDLVVKTDHMNPIIKQVQRLCYYIDIRIFILEKNTIFD